MTIEEYVQQQERELSDKGISLQVIKQLQQEIVKLQQEIKEIKELHGNKENN